MQSLNELLPAQRGTVHGISGSGALRRRLLDMGIVPGAEIEVVRVAPLGDPVEYLVKGYRLSLRRREAANVLVEPMPCTDCPQRAGVQCDAASQPRCPRWLSWLLRNGGDAQ